MSLTSSSERSCRGQQRYLLVRNSGRFLTSSLGLVLLAVVLLLVEVEGGLEHTCGAGSIPHSYGLCGPALSQTLQYLCNNGYNKRSLAFTQIEDEPLNDVDGLKELLLNKETALSYLHPLGSRGMYKRAPLQGIVCECCYNTCSVSELQQYCL